MSTIPARRMREDEWKPFGGSLVMNFSTLYLPRRRFSVLFHPRNFQLWFSYPNPAFISPVMWKIVRKMKMKRERKEKNSISYKKFFLFIEGFVKGNRPDYEALQLQFRGILRLLCCFDRTCKVIRWEIETISQEIAIELPRNDVKLSEREGKAHWVSSPTNAPATRKSFFNSTPFCRMIREFKQSPWLLQLRLLSLSVILVSPKFSRNHYSRDHLLSLENEKLSQWSFLSQHNYE